MSSSKAAVWLVLWLILFIGNAGGSTLAQQVAPAQTGRQQPPSARATSITFSQWVGFCGGCYCGVEVQVSPQGATLFKGAIRECQQQHPQKYRDVMVHADISSKHWKDLEKLADKGILFALPDRTGCASCVDGMDQMIEVKFKDGTKKSVQYPAGTSPKEIKPLTDKLLRLLAKLEDELVNYH